MTTADSSSVSTLPVSTKRPLWADITLLILRVVVGGLFAAAGFVKLTAPVEQFEAAIRTFDVVPSEALVHVVAVTLPWIELTVGFLLIAGALLRTVLWLHLLQILLYIVLISQGMLRGLDIECGCFGKSLPTTPSQALWRDLVLLLVVLILLRWLPTRWSVDGLSVRRPGVAKRSGDA